jgi:hypothetical protein
MAGLNLCRIIKQDNKFFQLSKPGDSPVLSQCLDAGAKSCYNESFSLTIPWYKNCIYYK